VKVKIVKDFKDKDTGRLYKAGHTVDFRKNRIKEIEASQAKRGYNLIETVKEDKKEDKNE